MDTDNDSSAVCIIQQLKERPFLERPKEEQNRIMENGRPTPSMPKLTKKYSNTNRRFNVRHYIRYEWLSGSQKMNKLFCWYCLLFEEKKTCGKYLWASNGYSDMRQLVMAANRHAFSQNHHKNMIKYHKFNQNGTTIDDFNVEEFGDKPKAPAIVKKANIKRCIINQILGTPFLERPLKEQLEIFQNGRPTPPMPLLFIYELISNSKIGFQSENYLKFKWMAGSQKLNRLYCWYCLLFADPNINEPWISIGFNRMEQFFPSAEAHEVSKIHLEHERKYIDFDRNFNTSDAFIKSEYMEPRETRKAPREVKIEDVQIQQPVSMDLVPPEPETSQFLDLDSKNFVKDFDNEEDDTDQHDEEALDTSLEDALNNQDNDYNMDDVDSYSDEQNEVESEQKLENIPEDDYFYTNDQDNQQEMYQENAPTSAPSTNDTVIDQLLTTNFSKLTDDLQKQILTTGRPIPNTPQFVKLSNYYYNKFEWLTANTQTNRYYCWYCLLLKEPFEVTFWGEEGISNTRNIPKRIEKHANSKIHFQTSKRYQEALTRLGVYVRPIRLGLREKEKEPLDYLLDKYKNDSCIVIQLLRNKFQNRSIEDQRKIIEQGRPTPKLPNLHGYYCGSKRNFRPVYYEKYQWLCGSVKLNKLFCWYCLLCSKSVWGREGVTNICKLTESLKKHNSSTSHAQCAAEHRKFGKTDEEFEKISDPAVTQEIVSNILSNSKRCLINELLGYPFADRPLDNQTEIIKNGRPLPDSTDGDPFIPNFFNINYYKYNWLTGSKKLKRLFCWPCLLYSDAASTNVWVQTGFDNVRKLSTAATKHENSKTHSRHLAQYESFKRTHLKDENAIVVKKSESDMEDNENDE